MNHASYIFSAYSTIKSLTAEQLLQVGVAQSKDSTPIPSFDENLLLNLCSDVLAIISREDNVLEIDGDTFIVGDIHGSFHDLLRILHYIDINDTKTVFLGDYVDRGFFSLECVTLLFTLKILYPNKIYLLRGNHEFDAMCSQYGFKKEILNYHNPKKVTPTTSPSEVNFTEDYQITNSNSINFDEIDDEKSKKKKEKFVSQETRCDDYFANHVNSHCYKYSEKLYDAIIEVFSYMPIASIVNGTNFCIHGGLSPLLDRIEKITKTIQRPIDNIDKNLLLTDLLWGDPTSSSDSFFSENPRGRGKLFNGVSVIKFLKNNFLTRMIRGHQCVNDGVEKKFNDKCITVFSASSYDKNMGNMSGVLKIFQKNDRCEEIIFDPIPRLNKCDALYFKVNAFQETKMSKPVLSQFNLKSVVSCGLINSPISKTSRKPDNFNCSSDNSDSDWNNLMPIQQTKSIRFKPIYTGKVVSFNTGGKSKKSLDAKMPKSGVNFLKPNLKFSNEDGNAMINTASTHICLPYLSHKTAI